MNNVIDLNSDLGEGFGAWTLGDDEAMLDLVTSANVACGFHAGDPTIMRRVCERASERGVVIGAQVGYRDLAGFGRRPMDVAPEDLLNEVVYQVAALDGFARLAGVRVQYVKPHGALYNTVVTDVEQASALVEAVCSYDPAMTVLGLPGSEWLRQAAAAGLRAVPEAFADRAYTPNGQLVSRRVPGSVLTDPEEVAARCVRLAREYTVEAVDGSVLAVGARSICIHGDTPGAVELGRRIRDALEDAGVTIRSFV